MAQAPEGGRRAEDARLDDLFKGAKVQPKLDGAKVWLSANNTAVMAVLLLVIGVTLSARASAACCRAATAM